MHNKDFMHSLRHSQKIQLRNFAHTCFLLAQKYGQIYFADILTQNTSYDVLFVRWNLLLMPYKIKRRFIETRCSHAVSVRSGESVLGLRYGYSFFLS